LGSDTDLPAEEEYTNEEDEQCVPPEESVSLIQSCSSADGEASKPGTRPGRSQKSRDLRQQQADEGQEEERAAAGKLPMPPSKRQELV